MALRKLRFERWRRPWVKGELGTIRTVPENYYVATVKKNGRLVFGKIEANTRNIDEVAVRRWWKAQKPNNNR